MCDVLVGCVVCVFDVFLAGDVATHGGVLVVLLFSWWGVFRPKTQVDLMVEVLLRQQQYVLLSRR